MAPKGTWLDPAKDLISLGSQAAGHGTPSDLRVLSLELALRETEAGEAEGEKERERERERERETETERRD
jgi:hypothetical protein